MRDLPQPPREICSGLKPAAVWANTQFPNGAPHARAIPAKLTKSTDKIALRTGTFATRSGCAASLNYFKLNQIQFVDDHSNKQQYLAAKQILLHQKQAMRTTTSEKTNTNYDQQNQFHQTYIRLKRQLELSNGSYQ